MTRSILPILAIAVGLCACKHPAQGTPTDTSKAMTVAPQPPPESVLAPIPFTAVQIRDASGGGLDVRTAPGLPGPPVRNTVQEDVVLTFEIRMISGEVVL